MSSEDTQPEANNPGLPEVVCSSRPLAVSLDHHDVFQLPEPRTETQKEEFEDELGRQVVITTTLHTTYERDDDDEDGNVVVLERTHRRVQRCVYVDGKVELESVMESGNGFEGDTAHQLQSGPVVEYVDEDYQIPEPSEATEVEEHVDEQGRRVVVTTVTNITYEESEDDDKNIVILEKRQRRVHRTIYEHGVLVEESTDEAGGDGSELAVSQLQSSTSADEIELPAPKEREEVEETLDELGRCVVTRTVFVTTYEQSRDGDGNVILLETVTKRIFRTVQDEPEDVLEQVSNIKIPSEAGVQLVMTSEMTSPAKPFSDFEVPEPREFEEVREYTDNLGRTVIEKTTTSITFELRDDDPSGDVIVLEKVHKRIKRTIYVDGKVVEETDENASVPESTPNAIEIAHGDVPTAISTTPLDTSLESDTGVLPTKVAEHVEESIDKEGRRIVRRIITTTTYERGIDDDGVPVILEVTVRRVIRIVYVDDMIFEKIEEPSSRPVVRTRSISEMILISQTDREPLADVESAALPRQVLSVSPTDGDSSMLSNVVAVELSVNDAPQQVSPVAFESLPASNDHLANENRTTPAGAILELEERSAGPVDTSLALSRLVGWSQAPVHASRTPPAGEKIRERDYEWPPLERATMENRAVAAALPPAELMTRGWTEVAVSVGDLPPLSELTSICPADQSHAVLDAEPSFSKSAPSPPGPKAGPDSGRCASERDLELSLQNPESSTPELQASQKSLDGVQAEPIEAGLRPRSKKKRRRNKKMYSPESHGSLVLSGGTGHSPPPDGGVGCSVSQIPSEGSKTTPTEPAQRMEYPEDTLANHADTSEQMAGGTPRTEVYRVTTETTSASHSASPTIDAESTEEYEDEHGRQIRTTRAVTSFWDQQPDGSAVQRQVERVSRAVLVGSGIPGDQDVKDEECEEVSDKGGNSFHGEGPAGGSVMKKDELDSAPVVAFEAQSKEDEVEPVELVSGSEGRVGLLENLEQGNATSGRSLIQTLDTLQPVVSISRTERQPNEEAISPDHPTDKANKKKKKPRKNKKSANVQLLTSRLPGYVLGSDDFSHGISKQKQPMSLPLGKPSEMPVSVSSTSTGTLPGNLDTVNDTVGSLDTPKCAEFPEAHSKVACSMPSIGNTTDDISAADHTPKIGDRPLLEHQSASSKSIETPSQETYFDRSCSTHSGPEPMDVPIRRKNRSKKKPKSSHSSQSISDATNRPHPSGLKEHSTPTEIDVGVSKTTDERCTSEPRIEPLSSPAVPVTPLKTEQQALDESVELVHGELLEEPVVEIVVKDSVDELGRVIKLRFIYVTFVEEVVDESGAKVTVKRVVRSTQRIREVDGEHLPIVEDVEEPMQQLSNEDLEKQLKDEYSQRAVGVLVEEPRVEIRLDETIDDRGRHVTTKIICISLIEEIIDEFTGTSVVRRAFRKQQKVTEMGGTSILEEIDEPEQVEVLTTSVPEATEASVLEDSMSTVTGELVGEPKVETFVEETVDDWGRPVKIKRVYVTIMDEVDTDGAKRLVKRVIKKTQRTTTENGRLVTADIYELIEEPPMEEQKERVLELCLPFVKGELVETPKVESRYEETMDSDGKPMTVVHFYVTVIESALDPVTGTTTINKRLIKKIRTVTEMDGVAVEEEFDESDEAQVIATSVPVASEASVIQECLPLLKGVLLVDPKAELDVEPGLDVNGDTITTRRIHVSLLEEIADETEAHRLARLVVKKTQRMRRVHGVTITENVEEPIIDPSKEELEEEVLLQSLPVVRGSLVDDPRVTSQTESTLSRLETPAKFTRFKITAIERGVGEDGHPTLIQHVIRKNRLVYHFDDKTVIEEYDDPEETEVLAVSLPEMTEDDVKQECLALVEGALLAPPEIITTVNEGTDEQGCPTTIRRVHVVLAEASEDECNGTVKWVCEKTQRMVDIDDQGGIERHFEVSSDMKLDVLRDDALRDCQNVVEGIVIGEPVVKTEFEEVVDSLYGPVKIHRFIVTLYEEVHDGEGNFVIKEIIFTKIRKAFHFGAVSVRKEYDEPIEVVTVATSVPKMTEDQALSDALSFVRGCLVEDPKTETIIDEETTDSKGHAVRLQTIYVTMFQDVSNPDGTKTRMKQVVKRSQRISEVMGRPVVADLWEYDADAPPSKDDSLHEWSLPIQGNVLGDPSVHSDVEETLDDEGRLITIRRRFVTVLEQIVDPAETVTVKERVFCKILKSYLVNGRLVTEEVDGPETSRVMSTSVPEITEAMVIEDALSMVTGCIVDEPVAEVVQKDADHDGETVTLRTITVKLTETVTDVAGVSRTVTRSVSRTQRIRVVPGGHVIETVRTVPEQPSRSVLQEEAISVCLWDVQGRLAEPATARTECDSAVDSRGRHVVSQRTSAALTELRPDGAMMHWTAAVLHRTVDEPDRLLVERWVEGPEATVVQHNTSAATPQPESDDVTVVRVATPQPESDDVTVVRVATPQPESDDVTVVQAATPPPESDDVTVVRDETQESSDALREAVAEQWVELAAEVAAAWAELYPVALEEPQLLADDVVAADDGSRVRRVHLTLLEQTTSQLDRPVVCQRTVTLEARRADGVEWVLPRQESAETLGFVVQPDPDDSYYQSKVAHLMEGPLTTPPAVQRHQETAIAPHGRTVTEERVTVTLLEQVRQQGRWHLRRRLVPVTRRTTTAGAFTVLLHEEIGEPSSTWLDESCQGDGGDRISGLAADHGVMHSLECGGDVMSDMAAGGDSAPIGDVKSPMSDGDVVSCLSAGGDVMPAPATSGDLVSNRAAGGDVDFEKTAPLDFIPALVDVGGDGADVDIGPDSDQLMELLSEGQSSPQYTPLKYPDPTVHTPLGLQYRDSPTRSDGSQTEDSLLDAPVVDSDDAEPALSLPSLPSLESAPTDDAAALLPLVVAYGALGRPAGVSVEGQLPPSSTDGSAETMRQCATLLVTQRADWPQARTQWVRLLVYVVGRLDHVVTTPAPTDDQLLAQLDELAAAEEVLRQLPERLQRLVGLQEASRHLLEAVVSHLAAAVRSGRDLVAGRRRRLDRHSANQQRLQHGLADGRRQLDQLQSWVAAITAAPDSEQRDTQMTLARAKLRGQQRQFWCQYLLAQRLSGADGDPALLSSLQPLQTLLQETHAALESTPARSVQPPAELLSATLWRLPCGDNTPLAVNTLPELRTLLPLYRRVVALLQHAPAHQLKPETGGADADGGCEQTRRRRQLVQLSAARVYWEELDDGMDQLDVWRQRCATTLTALNEQVNVDDDQLLPLLEEMCRKSASVPVRLADLETLLAQLQQRVTARAAQLRLVRLRAELSELRRRLEPAVAQLVDCQRQLADVRRNSDRIDKWVRRVQKITKRYPPPSENELDELLDQADNLHHLGSTTADLLDTTLSCMAVTDEELLRSRLELSRRRLSQLTAGLRGGAGADADRLAAQQRRADTLLARAVSGGQLAPAVSALDSLCRWLDGAGHDTAEAAGRAAALRRRLDAQLAALRPLCRRLAVLRADGAAARGRLLLLARLRQPATPALRAEAVALQRLAAALASRWPHVSAVKVVETEIGELTSLLTSLGDESCDQGSPDQLKADLDQLADYVWEVERQWVTCPGDVDCGTEPQLTAAAADGQERGRRLLCLEPASATSISELVPPLADRCRQLRREAANALAAETQLCRRAAADWSQLTALLTAVETWLDRREAASDATEVDQCLLEQLNTQHTELGTCSSLLDTVTSYGRVSVAAREQLSAQLAAAGHRLDAVDGQLRSRRAEGEQRVRLRPRLQALRARLRQADDSRQLEQLQLLTPQLVDAVELGRELHQLCGAAVGPEAWEEAVSLLHDWEMAMLALADHYRSVVTAALQSSREDELVTAQQQLMLSVTPDRADQTSEQQMVDIRHTQTVEVILGLHRDQLALELACPHPPVRHHQLAEQLADVLRQLWQLRSGRARAPHWAAYSMLLDRFLVWLRRADVEKMCLEASPLAPDQLAPRRRQLATLSRRLPRGGRLLAELRRLSAAAGRPPAQLTTLQNRHANLTAGVATWANYVAYVADFWRRRRELVDDVAARLSDAEADEEGVAGLDAAALDRLGADLDEADSLWQPVQALATADADCAAQQEAAQLRVRLLLLRLLRIVDAERQADLDTTRRLQLIREELSEAAQQRLVSGLRGDGQRSLPALLAYLETQLPAELAAAGQPEGEADPLRLRAARLVKLQSVLETAADFEGRTPALETRLADMEAVLNAPPQFDDTDEVELQALQLTTNDVLREVRDASREMSDVTSLCELMVGDCDGLPGMREVKSVTETGEDLQQRWRLVCDASAGRRAAIAEAWAAVQRLDRLTAEFRSHLDTAPPPTAGPPVPRAQLAAERQRADSTVARLRAADELRALLDDQLRLGRLQPAGRLAGRAQAQLERAAPLRQPAQEAAARLERLTAVHAHQAGDWQQLERRADQLLTTAEQLQQRLHAGHRDDSATQLAEVRSERNLLADQLQRVTAATAGQLQQQCPLDADWYDLSPPDSCRQLDKTLADLGRLCETEQQDVDDAAAQPASHEPEPEPEPSDGAPIAAALRQAEAALAGLEALLATPSPPAVQLGQALGACSAAADLLEALGGECEPRAVALRRRLDSLGAEAHGKLRGEQRALLRWQLDVWRLEQWLQHTDSKMAAMPGPTAPLASWSEVHTRRLRRLGVELESHTGLMAVVSMTGQRLAEAVPAADAPAVHTRLAALQSSWDDVCGRLMALQSRLPSTDLPDGQAPTSTGPSLLGRTLLAVRRVLRVSLPFQALLLLALAVLALYPACEPGQHCDSAHNNLAQSLETMLRYPHGPPPI